MISSKWFTNSGIPVSQVRVNTFTYQDFGALTNRLTQDFESMPKDATFIAFTYNSPVREKWLKFTDLFRKETYPQYQIIGYVIGNKFMLKYITDGVFKRKILNQVANILTQSQVKVTSFGLCDGTPDYYNETKAKIEQFLGYNLESD